MTFLEIVIANKFSQQIFLGKIRSYVLNKDLHNERRFLTL